MHPCSKTSQKQNMGLSEAFTKCQSIQQKQKTKIQQEKTHENSINLQKGQNRIMKRFRTKNHSEAIAKQETKLQKKQYKKDNKKTPEHSSRAVFRVVTSAGLEPATF